MPEEKKGQPTIVKSAAMDRVYTGLKTINVEEIRAKLQAAGANFEPKYKVIKEFKKADGGTYGVGETIDVLAVVLSLVKAFIDGGITNYLAALVQLPEAIIGINQVPLEIEDLDEADVQLIIDFVIENFPTLPTAKVQEIVNHSIKALFHIYQVIVIVAEHSEDPEKLDAPAVTGDGIKRNPEYKE